jgi:hypothetical protein
MAHVGMFGSMQECQQAAKGVASYGRGSPMHWKSGEPTPFPKKSGA